MSDQIHRKRIIVNGEVFYPITDAYSILHLQKEITDKLPIVSDIQPASGTFVPKQAWLDISEEEQEDDSTVLQSLNEIESVPTRGLAFGSDLPLVGTLLFDENNQSENLSFAENEEDENLSFVGKGNNNIENGLCFAETPQQESVFGESEDNERLIFEGEMNANENLS